MRIHPLDFDALEKGTVITRDQIERIYNVSAKTNPDGFRRATLRLREQIERERDDLLTRHDGDNIRVMEDLEADHRTFQRGRNAVKALARNARRRAAIDRSGFTDEQRRDAESRDRMMTAMAIASRKAMATAARQQLLSAGPSAEPTDVEAR